VTKPGADMAAATCGVPVCWEHESPCLGFGIAKSVESSSLSLTKVGKMLL
jgi:hypothetical protein